MACCTSSFYKSTIQKDEEKVEISFPTSVDS